MTAAGSLRGVLGGCLLCVLACAPPAVDAAPPLRILALGDSITQGRGSQSRGGKDWTPTYSYRYPLWKMLVDEGVAFDMVGSLDGGFEGDPDWKDYQGRAFDRDHEGHWGWKTTDVAAKLPGWIEGSTPDIVTILLGSNDVRGDTREEKLASVERVRQAMEKIVAILRRRNPQVVILLGQCFQEWEPFADMREAMVELAQKQNRPESPVVVVDHSRGWISNPQTDGTHTVDWVHPNPAGDEKLARNYFAAMKPYLHREEDETRSFDSPRLPAECSWLGNSFPGADAWIQQDIRALTVTPDGTVLTNVEWEEGGGNVGEYRDGRLVRYARHTHGWGALGGEAIAANAGYVYLGGLFHNEGGHLQDEGTWPPKGKKWLGISRRQRRDMTQAAPFPGGKGGKGDTLRGCFLPVVEVPDQTSGHLAGLAASDTRLYVANPHDRRIELFDAQSMQPVTHWPCDRPGPLQLDAAGALWMLEPAQEGEAARLVKFTAAGGVEPVPIAWPAESRPVAFGISPRGELYVADDGPAQQILVFRVAGGEPIRAIGRPGGIYSGIPGAFGDLKFNRISALGLDAVGNLYVAHDGQSGGGGTVLECYSPAEKLLWRLFGLTFVDMADADPVTDTDVFTKEEHFHMDYAKPRGTEWSYAGYTVHRFKYPQDPRLHVWSAGAWVRQIWGRRILLVNDMNGEHLQVYRFQPETEGEIAIPSGMFAKRHVPQRNSSGWPPHQPAHGEWIWRDANGNGAFDAGEFAQNGGEDAPASQGWWVDAQGNVWLATQRQGIRFLPVQGVDGQGNPNWDFAKMRVFPHPKGFDEVKRLRYDPASDVLYVGGTTAEHKNQHWKPMGPVIARYDRWRETGGRAPRRWTLVAPYVQGSSGHTSCEPMGFDVAGDYLFVPYTGASREDKVATGRVEVFRADDASPAGHFEPSADVGEIGLQDVRECLRAHRRVDGEYLVFLEDDYKAKVLMYRWKPGGRGHI
ncbi:MAG: hypothetical protein JXB62_11105 [Pirellulales bacterium]|nr:hypothetical protein [Pirellulales bacterium]